MSAPLGPYRAKRDFNKTSEPQGVEGPRGGRVFVVQQHAARRMHYDLRLELDGVLLSWAVPKGPSTHPDHKRLAVQTEDHPVAYADFEGTIPKESYGAGSMIVWDRGTWEPTGNAHLGLKRGRLLFTLYGAKLEGIWLLVRTGATDSNQWLLRKIDDAFAHKIGDITQDRPESVLSARRIEAMAAHRKRPTAPSVSKPLPPIIHAQLASASSSLPTAAGWFYEVKLDGYRLLAKKCGADVALTTRSGLDWSRRLPELAASLARLPLDRCVLDGELVFLARDGTSSFADLQSALTAGNTAPLIFCAFDALILGDQDIRDWPLRRRKAALARLLRGAGVAGNLSYWAHATGAKAGREALAVAKLHGLEGIVAKRAGSSYTMSRCQDWLKVKCTLQTEFWVVGYGLREGTQDLSSLLLGHEQADGTYVYVGRVAAGLKWLSPQHRALMVGAARKGCPCVPVVRDDVAQWVKPQLPVVVRFAQWTPQGHLRHAVLLGVREDFVPQGLKPAREPSLPGAKPLLTHPKRRVAPKSSVTKLALAQYLKLVAPLMLLDLAERPLSVLRCPKPDLKDVFFQKHLAQDLPGLGQSLIDGKAYSHVQDVHGLLVLAQLSVLELHPWGCQAHSIEQPDIMTFDLDPGPDVPTDQTVAAAKTLRSVLRQLGLVSAVKATGGKGLHVVVMGLSGCSWGGLQAISQLIAHYVVARDPAHFTAIMGRKARSGKVFVDFYRNARGSTAIAPYSPRARAGLPLARSLSWAELNPSTIEVPWDVAEANLKLTKGLHDPWRRYRTLQQTLSKELINEALNYVDKL